MKTVAIICEYNPFHNGHEYHINKIREEFGIDTRIVAIMSGNYTQRGELAIMDKFTRAKCAVLAGVNLVLELPFPYSISSAEHFARSAVTIINLLGNVDYLSFGSECGDIDELSVVASRMLTKSYIERVRELINSDKYLTYGYPQITELAYADIYGSTLAKEFFSPNNILALEYMKAIISFGSNIKPHTVKRIGAAFSENELIDEKFQSATAIRRALKVNIEQILPYIPKSTWDTVIDEYNNGYFPCDAEKLSSAILTNLRLNLSSEIGDIHDTDDGLYNRIRNASFDTDNLISLTEQVCTKKYTTARIRRSIWYTLFGVTSSDVKSLPKYTQILAMDNVGTAILKEIKKVTQLEIQTKPSATSTLSATAKKQKSLSDKADSVFHLSKPRFVSGNKSLTSTPFVLE
jgi:predicted nucleotidyltransferase